MTRENIGRNILKIQIEKKENTSSYLPDLLASYGYPLQFPCGRKGNCGKCRIRIEAHQGLSEISEKERKIFSGGERDDGWRLACKTYVLGPATLTVEIPEQILLAKAPLESEIFPERRKELIAGEGREENFSKKSEKYGLAIDLGTTTIALALLDIENQEIVSKTSIKNSQASYGADVLSRIEAAGRGLAEELKKCVIKDLREAAILICKRAHVEISQVMQIVIAGNTTMCHLLLGYPVEGLGKAPFEPHKLNYDIISSCDLFDPEHNTNIDVASKTYIFPGISAFIGGDILSGIFAVENRWKEGLAKDEPWLLLDFGTNGEMVLWTGETYLATSAAAGPAFEGGNISCGLASTMGAIEEVIIAGRKVHVKTIGAVPAVGICGSGLLSAIAGMKRNHIIDSDGTFTEDVDSVMPGASTISASFKSEEQDSLGKSFSLYKADGQKEISITQEDIRQFQMAKAAIAAGVEILLKKANLTPAEIKRVYLAGGFGVHMDVGAASFLGLIPKEMRAVSVGVENTSLDGAILHLLNRDITDVHTSEIQAVEECIDDIDKKEPCKRKKRKTYLREIDFLNSICENTQVLSLAEETDFEETYIRHMTLDEWR